MSVRDNYKNLSTSLIADMREESQMELDIKFSVYVKNLVIE